MLCDALVALKIVHTTVNTMLEVSTLRFAVHASVLFLSQFSNHLPTHMHHNK